MSIESSPLVSVIMPTYNGEKFIEASLASAIGQKYPHIEFIVINDGSTDSTADIVRSMQEKDERISLLTHTTNKGIPKTLNTGLSHARGKYIAPLDQDDLQIDPYKIDKQVSFLERHPDIGFLGTNTITRQQDSSGFTFYQCDYPLSDDVIRKNLLFSNPFTHSSMMYRNMYDEIGGYPENKKYAPDYGYWLEGGKYTKFANLSDYTTLYNSHFNNASHTHGGAQKLEALELARKYRNNYPGTLKRLSYRTYEVLYALLSHSMEKHCPSLKNEIRKILKKPIPQTAQSNVPMNELISLLQTHSFKE